MLMSNEHKLSLALLSAWAQNTKTKTRSDRSTWPINISMDWHNKKLLHLELLLYPTFYNFYTKFNNIKEHSDVKL